jgi:glutamine---fructose-6-phosphate transaminase (isomerizing)
MSAAGQTTMALEISEQPLALRQTGEALAVHRERLQALAARTRRVIFFARGSSDTAATYGRYLVEIAAGLPAALGAPSVATLYRSRQDLVGSLVVLCSQSGRTGEISEVAQWARDCGAHTVAVTNDGDSPLAQQTDLALVTHAGHERAVPATKSHTTALLAMAEIAAALAPNHPALQSDLARVPSDAARLVTEGADVAATIADAICGASAVAVTGRGYSYATAIEVALKIEETCLLPCLGLSQADLQHGPQAVLGPSTPLVVASAVTGPTLVGLQAVAESAASRGAPVVALGGSAQLRALASWSLPASHLPEPIAPITQVIPGQQLAEALSRALGHDPDAPPSLAKVTRTA